MCLAKIVFAVFIWTTVTNYVFVSGQEEDEQTDPKDELTDPPEEKTEPPPVEKHTFVALIDIVFVDGSKRQCTGTIIHDYAVVTAAHCFLSRSPNYADIEMSSSFIVIGTKKMFDTGYENYLPIERIITHPSYKGWTADIALVFTFAGMVTDKPGYAIPLIGESVSTPMDSNVTILSWGHCAEDAEKQPRTHWPARKERLCTSSEDENDSCEMPSTHKPLRAGHSSEQEHSSEQASSQHRAFLRDKSDASTIDSGRVTSAHNSHRVLAPVNAQKLSQDNAVDNSNQPNESQESHEPMEHPPINVTFGHDNQTETITENLHVTTAAKVKIKENFTKATSQDERRHRKHRYQKTSRNMTIAHAKDQKWTKDQMLVQQRSGRNASLEGKIARILESYNKSWRRQAKPKGYKENTLSIETFGFVNVQTCKKLVDKVLPPLYAINTNEIVCYAADEHYISDDDTGAPAIRQGQLVAVTLGGVECDGDHVAIGLKMNCFCSWIVENLPEKDLDWNCCKDCCNGDQPRRKRKLRSRSEY